MHSALATFLLLLLFQIDVVSSSFDDDSDLATYVTVLVAQRPEFRAPLFNVTAYKPESITPGYWFTAPYASLYGETSSERYETCQVGPHIYDHEGNLVWSGACLVKNRPTCDFRVSTYYNSPSLSMVLAPDPRQEEEDPRGVGWIMDNHFELRKTVHMREMIPSFNMHEFNILDNGRTALVVTKDDGFQPISSGSKKIKVKISDNGFQEIDILTGEVLFSWDAMDHIPLSEAVVPPKSFDLENAPPWDFVHLNSVDKSAEGDYLISARHTSTIYKVSGEDGSIIWQLGGLSSSFDQNGFNFSYQHDARFQYQRGDITVISYLNNAADTITDTANYSSAQLVKLNTDSMTANLLSEWDRPDHNLTRLRGNVQVLDNGNAFVGWSANSYISEFTPEGELALEAQFLSERFATYRSYKFNFTGLPSEPPTLKAFAYGIDSSAESTSTVSYVSWNGATEVVSWDFYASANDSLAEEFTYIGSTNKTGFETMFTVDGYMGYIIAEGIDKDGNSLGQSPIEATELPSNWVSAPTAPWNSSNSNSSELDQGLFQASVEAINVWVGGGREPEVRIPLPVFILFFSFCALGTIFGVVYSLRHRVAWLCGTNYQSLDDTEQVDEVEERYLDIQKFEREEEDYVDRDGGYDTSDSASEDDR
ncbi:hypothetical protein FQN54_003624 [Arachnomyces sp. PD_36]|nr:hypothetical protein FQN54_003624 [Arachnomyces sp. PD_36]